MKSTHQQRPVSTLGFSEWKVSADEVAAAEKMTAAHSTVELLVDDATDNVDTQSKQVYTAAYFYSMFMTTDHVS